MIFKDSLGVDIRENELAVAYLKKTFSSIKIVSHAVYSLEANRPLAEKLIAVNALLTDFRQENNIGNTDIFIGIPEALVLFRKAEFPLAVKENLHTTIGYEMEKYIPLSSENVYFDCQIFKEDKKTNQLEFLLVIAKKAAIQPYLDFCKTISGISGIEAASISVSNYLSYVSNNKILEECIQKTLKAHEDPGYILLESAGFKIKGLPQEIIAPFGLALKGLLTVPVQINLLPPKLRKISGKMKYYIMIGLVFMVVLSVAGLGASHIIRQNMALKELDSELNRLKSEITEIGQIQERITETEVKIDNFNSLLKGYVSVSDIVKELTRIIPETAWIRDLSISAKNIQLQGYADSASELIGILEASPRFKDIVMLSAIVKERDGKERFSFSLKLE